LGHVGIRHGSQQMSVRADAETLRLIPLFRSCDAVPLQILAFSAQRLTFDMDEILFSEDEMPRGAFLVMSGSVSILRKGKVTAVAEEGALLGETAMIGNVAYSIGARARESVTTALIDQDLFLKVAREYPDFGHNVLNALSDKLSGTVRDFDRVRVLLAAARPYSDL
jgi:CRP-like cAMP-binding protein